MMIAVLGPSRFATLGDSGPDAAATISSPNSVGKIMVLVDTSLKDYLTLGWNVGIARCF